MNATNKPMQAVRVPFFKGVSCITVLETADYSGRSHTNYFDVPDEDFTDGSLTGTKAAFEIMTAAACNDDFDCFQSVLEAAFKVLRQSEDNHDFKKDGAGAAVGLLSTMSEILELAAVKLDLSVLMAQSLDGHEAMLQNSLDEIKADNEAFVKRMKAGKAKKNGGAA